jgi:hypothetical protein
MSQRRAEAHSRSTVLTWNTIPGAAEYHVYRDLRSNLSYENFGVCRDDLDAARTDTQLTDSSNPAAGAAGRRFGCRGSWREFGVSCGASLAPVR